MEDFGSGFTNKSYFNIVKQVALGIYENALKEKKLDFKFHNAETINAYAAYSALDDKDIMSLNVGTVVDIFAMMKTAFSQKGIMTLFGDALLERNRKIKGRFEENDYSIRYNGDVNDTTRNTLSTYASLFALRFIISHELGHIVNGHTRLLQDLYMNSKIEMIQKHEKQNEKYALDRRTLEMDADASAATNSINNVITLYCQYRNDDIFSVLKAPEEIFAVWSFAITCIFLEFENIHQTNYSDKSCYLPNAARFIMVMSSAEQTVKNYVKYGMTPNLFEYRNEILSNVKYGVEQAHFFFENIYGSKYSLLKQIINSRQQFEGKSDEVHENWNNNLYEKLKKYSKMPLYLPSKVDETMKQIKAEWNLNSFA